MKKLLAIIIAAVMIAACSVTAFADTTTVSYDVDPSYTVAIPASVTLADADVTADITASDVIMEDGKQILVELTSASNTASGSTFNAKNGDSAVTYTITGDSAISVGDTVATFTADGSKTLTFSAADKSAATVAGAHTETLTFNIAVEDATPATVLSGALVDGAAIKVNFKWRGSDTGDYVQGVYNASSGTFTVTKGGFYWSDAERAVYKVEKSGDNIIIGAGYSNYDGEGMVWTFNTNDDTYTYTQGSKVSSNPDWYGLTSVTLNGTNITSQLTKN